MNLADGNSGKFLRSWYCVDDESGFGDGVWGIPGY